MAYFAKLDDHNKVLEVHVIDNQHVNDLPFPQSEPLGVAFLTEWSGGYDNWKQTSYNANFRKHYAGVGYTYDALLDAFIPPKPFPSWTLDMARCAWVPPLPFPENGVGVEWDEATQNWVGDFK